MSHSSSSSRTHQGSKKVNVICDCGDVCSLRIAYTPWNRGKKFYSCPNFREENHCNFFRWAGEFKETEQYDTREVDERLVEILIENRELRKENSALMLKNKVMARYKIGVIVTWIGILVGLIIYLC